MSRRARTRGDKRDRWESTAEVSALEIQIPAPGAISEILAPVAAEVEALRADNARLRAENESLRAVRYGQQEPQQ